MSAHDRPELARMDCQAPDHPVALRPVIFDPRIGLRRLFFDELDDVAKRREHDYTESLNNERYK